MDSVNHFEIPADDVDRARKFYESVFNWKTQSMEGMDYIFATSVKVDEDGNFSKPGAINGGIMKREKPFSGPTIAITVDNIEETLEKVHEKGGEVIINKQAVGDMGFIAYFKDTENNLIGMWEATKK